MKMCQLYNLIQQGLKSYHKNIRNLSMTDESFRKLENLMNLIINALNICVKKNLFNKRDFLIKELFSKCLDLVKFIRNYELLEPRQKNEIKRRIKNQTSARIASTARKMNEKKLSMYDVSGVDNRRRATPKTNRKKVIPKPLLQQNQEKHTHRRPVNQQEKILQEKQKQCQRQLNVLSNGQKTLVEVS